MTLLCKKITVAKSKEVKTRWSIDKSGRTFKEGLWLKKGCLASDNNDDDEIWIYCHLHQQKNKWVPVSQHTLNDLFLILGLLNVILTT
jgi:hypothetical protein